MDYFTDDIAGYAIIFFGDERTEIEFTEDIVLINDLHSILLVAGEGIEPTCMAYETIE